MRKRFVIFGHKRHGKDTVCEYIQAKYGINFISSSLFIARHHLFEVMREEHGYQSVEECFEDRGNHRAYWFDFIRNYTLVDPTKLAREIFASNEVYCGIRSDIEFEAMRDQGLFDLSIYVDASERLPLEDPESMKLTKYHGDIVVDNNGDLETLYKRLDRLFQAMGYEDITKKKKAA